MNAGDSFHMESLTSTTKHLYFVLTDPNPMGELVIANVTSQGSSKDQTCILRRGDHPAIYHESVINYAEAIITSEDALNRAARAQVVQWDAAASPEVLKRIQDGAISSVQTEPQVAEMVKEALGG